MIIRPYWRHAGLSREAATQNSPGLALGQLVNESALPVRRSSGMRDEGGKVAPEIRRVGGITHRELKDGSRPPLSGRTSRRAQPQG